MRAVAIVLFYYGYAANLCLAASILDNGHLSNANNLNLRNLLPKSLVHDIQQNQQQQQQQQYFDSLIHNDIQYAQQLPADQNVYYANTKRPSGHNEIIDVQVPTRADANKILLHLPKHHQVYSSASASPSQPFYVAPRKHYRITLIRNHKPAPPSPPAPEVEQNTLIYVLIKKPDQSDVNANEESPNIESEQNSFKLNPPEVYFINYKANKSKSDGYTAAAAAAAQTNPEQRHEDTSKV